MRYKVFIIFSIIFNNLVSQKLDGLYIEPTLSYKVFTTNKSESNEPLQTSYFKVEQRNKSHVTFSNLLFGINFGYKFSNDDKIQIGISSDRTYSGYRVSGMTIIPDTQNVRYMETRLEGGSGNGYTNYSLLYKRKILHITSRFLNPGRFVSVHVNLGINYNYFLPVEGFGSSSSSFMAPDSSIVTASDITYLPGRSSFKVNFGLDFTVGKKEKEWFTFNISYIFGRRIPITTNVTIEINNKNSKNLYYYNINGTSNGIYFTLSKRVYSFKIFSDKREKKAAKQKSIN